MQVGKKERFIKLTFMVFIACKYVDPTTRQEETVDAAGCMSRCSGWGEGYVGHCIPYPSGLTHCDCRNENLILYG